METNLPETNSTKSEPETVLNAPILEIDKGAKELLKFSDGRIVTSKRVATDGSLANLSKRARVFLELIIAGHKTLEAYELAGFKGTGHAAYQLRWELKQQLALMLEASGISQEDVKMKLLELLKLPLSSVSVTAETQLKLLKFADKLTEGERRGKPKITPFTMNVTGSAQVQVNGINNGTEAPEGGAEEGI